MGPPQQGRASSTGSYSQVQQSQSSTRTGGGGRNQADAGGNAGTRVPSRGPPAWQKRSWKCTGRGGCGEVGNPAGSSRCKNCGALWDYKARDAEAAGGGANKSQSRSSAAPWQSQQPPQQKAELPKAASPSSDEAQLAKLQRCYDTCAQQMGPEHETSLRFGIELQSLKNKLQAAKPVGQQLQSAQSRLQQLEMAMLKVHEEIEDLDEELAKLQKKRDALFVRGRELHANVGAAKADVARIAGMVAAATAKPEKSGSPEEMQRLATTMSAMVPEGHPSRVAVGVLLEQIFGLLVVAPPSPAAPCGTATPHSAAAAAEVVVAKAAAGTVGIAAEREASVARDGRKRRALAAARRADDSMFDEGSENAAQVGRAPQTPHDAGGMAVSDDELETPWSGFATPSPPAPAMLGDAAGEVQIQRVAAASLAFAGSQDGGTFLQGAAPGGTQEG